MPAFFEILDLVRNWEFPGALLSVLFDLNALLLAGSCRPVSCHEAARAGLMLAYARSREHSRSLYATLLLRVFSAGRSPPARTLHVFFCHGPESIRLQPL